jgi:anti-sigma factor RsiW
MTSEHESVETDSIEGLLPWHAAGTLSRRDAERVEAALARDPELARRYELVREEFGATIALNESLGAPSPRALEKLLMKVDAEPPRRSRALRGLGARINDFFGSLPPRTLAWASAAAVIAIMIQAGFIGLMVSEPPAVRHFQTASAPTTAPGVGAFTIIRFAPQATMDDVNKFLETNHFNVVSGPSAGGLYKVRVAEKALPQEELGALARKLQNDKLVGFVAPTR